MPSYRRGRPTGKRDRWRGGRQGGCRRALPLVRRADHTVASGRFRGRWRRAASGSGVRRPASGDGLDGPRASGPLAAQPGSWRRSRALGGAAGRRSRASRRGGGSPAAPRHDYGPRHRGRGDGRSGAGGRAAPPPANGLRSALPPSCRPAQALPPSCRPTQALPPSGLRRPLRPSCRP